MPKHFSRVTVVSGIVKKIFVGPPLISHINLVDSIDGYALEFLTESHSQIVSLIMEPDIRNVQFQNKIVL